MLNAKRKKNAIVFRRKDFVMMSNRKKTQRAMGEKRKVVFELSKLHPHYELPIIF